MQKLDFIENLDVIAKELRSEEVFNIFQSGFNTPNNPYAYNLVTPILFSSKGNFDNLWKDSKYQQILTSLNANKIYSDDNLANMVSGLVATTANQILIRANIVQLFNFHNSLLMSLKLSREVLMSAGVSGDYDKSLNDGILVFQIVNQDDGLRTNQYIKIFTALRDLIDAVDKALGINDHQQEIILLDSGSDTNVGVKTQVETANAIFSIFKEVWDFIVNRKFQSQEKFNKTLVESLTIRKTIQDKVKEGVLTEDEAKEYTHLIKTRTDNLIGMKALPKQIVKESKLVENKNLIEELELIKLLGTSDSDD